MKRLLREVLAGFPAKSLSQIDSSALDIEISSVTSDSREVKKGAIFVAVKGGTQDGSQFVSQAEKSGASLIVGEDPKPEGCKAPYLQTAGARLALARLAANFYGNPTRSMKVIGVTGTSGKTTTTYVIESILKAAGYEVGVIGTVNFRYGSKTYPSTHTTPGPVELQGLVAAMKADGCNAVVMEVSSHALKQHRAAFVAFDSMVFLNLSPEHLDFHPDMEDYFQAKAILFRGSVIFSVEAGKSPVAVINQDDEYGARLTKELVARPNPRLHVSGFFMSPGDLEVSLSGIRGKIGQVDVRSSLVGTFNGSNILAAIGATQGVGVNPKDISRGIENLKAVPGRLERVPSRTGIHVLVDYAHKSDALEKVLKTLSTVQKGGKLITVFGCGGDRDRTKRPVMGQLACSLSDRVLITSDNPRTEAPDAIIGEIVAGTKGFKNYEIEPDRKRAIAAAISGAKPGDLVLIAGKGHEDYQIIADPGAPGGTRKIHFDDREVAAEALQAREQS